MKQVIAMRAIPGSGKSTFAKYIFENTISKNKTSIIVSADDFFLTNQEYKFDLTKIEDARKFCYKNFIQAITNNIDVVIIDNTNLAAWEISPYKTYSEYSDYSFHIYQISVEPQIAFNRQKHNVPDKNHKRMSLIFNKEFFPNNWEITKFNSKTNKDGQPVFEEEI